MVEALPFGGKGIKAPDLHLWRSSIQDYVRGVLLVYACLRAGVRMRCASNIWRAKTYRNGCLEVTCVTYAESTLV